MKKNLKLELREPLSNLNIVQIITILKRQFNNVFKRGIIRTAFANLEMLAKGH